MYKQNNSTVAYKATNKRSGPEKAIKGTMYSVNDFPLTACKSGRNANPQKNIPRATNWVSCALSDGRIIRG